MPFAMLSGTHTVGIFIVMLVLALAVLVQWPAGATQQPLQPALTKITFNGTAERALERGLIHAVLTGYIQALDELARVAPATKPMCSAITSRAREAVTASLNGKLASLSVESRNGVMQAADKLADALDVFMRENHCLASANPANAGLRDVQDLRSQLGDLASVFDTGASVA